MCLRVKGISLIVEGISLVVEKISLIVEGISLILEGISLIVKGMSFIVEGTSHIVESISLTVEGIGLVVEGTSLILERIQYNKWWQQGERQHGGDIEGVDWPVVHWLLRCVYYWSYLGGCGPRLWWQCYPSEWFQTLSASTRVTVCYTAGSPTAML